MAEEGIKGKTLTLKLKPVTFETFTRSVTLQSYVTSYDQICSAALELLAKELPLNIRLMASGSTATAAMRTLTPARCSHYVILYYIIYMFYYTF